MSGYDAFLTYQAVKLHFTTDSYDYFKFQGKYRCSVDTFEQRKDRYFYHKLDRLYPTKEDMVFFLAANFFAGTSTWIRELLSEDAITIYQTRKKIKESLEYTVMADLDRLKIYTASELSSSILVDDGAYPPLLSAMMQQEIYPETVLALNTLIGFMSTWNKKISDTIIYPSLTKKLQRYAPFLTVDKKKLSHLLRKRLDTPQ